MASTTETGHAKNVANLDELISFVLGYGKDYNPSKPSIKADALQSLSDYAKKAIEGVNSAFPSYSKAVAEREDAFAPLSKLVTRILNSLKATDSSDQVNGSAITLARKIQGKRASSKKTGTDESEKETIEISASQMSYNSRLDNLDKFIKLLASVTLYIPNEEDLKVTTLTALYNDLKTKNAAVINSTVPLINARISRNEILYKENSGLIDIASDAKTYIKSVFGASSPQFKQVSKLNFISLN